MLSVQPDLQLQIQKFWALEENSPTRYFSSEEECCEEHFVENTTRGLDGRFVVSLPFRSDPNTLGESRVSAMRRFLQLERKWSRQPNVKETYINVLKDYLDMGHMEEVPDAELNTINRPVFYLPHHAVIKEQSLSTKLRVVFDGSCPSSTGISLNDLLMVGPTIQEDLLSIVLRFRMHRHVITADIIKMYRQIRISPENADLHRVLWRTDRNESVRTYRLNTVTFGTAAATFLATRCLVQAANLGADLYPDAALVIKRDFYVDDLLTGASTQARLTVLKNQISHLLVKTGFILHKWNSTIFELRDEVQGDPTTVELTSQDPVKTLGIFWESIGDQFSYQLKPKSTPSRCTKRIILTVIAGIFDPLGLLAPITVNAKMIMQLLWQIRSGWDEAVSQEIFYKWKRFEDELPRVNDLRIPRRVISLEQPIGTYLHGFCDASEKAYGACIYVCAVDRLDHRSANLLCARSRVAPLKTISIPRLELCSAVLLAQTVNKVISSLETPPETITLWSDSTVSLAWIASSPHRWKTFVANRVSEIQTLTACAEWRHVSSEENPADMISRGCTPDQLCQETSLWWYGPRWLTMDISHWPSAPTLPDTPTTLPEAREAVIAMVVITTELELFRRYSSLPKLIKVTAFCLRFINNCQSPNKRTSSPLTVSERTQALHKLLKVAQAEKFSLEIGKLKGTGSLPTTSRLLPLAPFLDKEGLFRVGGRLQNAHLHEDQRHPILLPPQHPLTTLIIKDEHARHLHAGTLGTLSAVRQRFWPLSGRRTVQGVIRSCTTCFRIRPALQTPPMGQLPTSRITPSRPFSTCGVDFAGPFLLRQGGPRSKARVKAYMAVLVWFST